MKFDNLSTFNWKIKIISKNMNTSTFLISKNIPVITKQTQNKEKLRN